MPLPTEIITWWNALPREEQQESLHELVALMKPKPYFIKVKPTIKAVIEVMRSLNELGIKSEPENLEGKLVFRFESARDRNIILQHVAFSYVEK